MKTQAGYTLIEVLVSSVLLLIVVALVGGHVNFQKKTFVDGALRSRLNQNLRGTLDIVGTDIRIGGENLPLAFPSFLITDGGTSSDQLSVRRAVLEDALPLCVAIAAGSSTTTLTVADNALTTPAGCGYTGNKTIYDRWSTYRTQQGGSIKAYIFNLTTRDGEFFDYNAETDLTTKLQLRRPGGSAAFTYSYPAGTSVLYVLEEWKYQVQNDELQVIQNGDSASPLTVMFNVDKFNASATMSDGTVKTALIKTDNWTLIRSLTLSITGKDTKAGIDVLRVATSRFFPRNILSF